MNVKPKKHGAIYRIYSALYTPIEASCPQKKIF